MPVRVPANLAERFLRSRGPWLSTGWALVALGASGLIGWAAGVWALVQPFPSRPPIRPLGALGLLGLGLSAMAFHRERRRLSMATASVSLLIAYLALIQFAGVELRFLAPLSLPETASSLGADTPQILPVAAAIGIILGGGSLLVIASRFREETAGTFAVGLAGSVMVALNLAVLSGQLFGLSPEVRHGEIAGVSPQVALGCLVLGLCLTSVAWSRVWVPATYPAWVPPGVGLASLVVILFLWRALIQTQRDDHAALLRNVARATGDRLEESMGRINLALWRVAWISEPATVGNPAWFAFVRNVLSGEPGLTHLAWVGQRGRTILIEPPLADSAVLRTQFALQLASRESAGPWAPDSVGHFALADSAGSVAAVVRRCDLDDCTGFVVGLIRVDQMFQDLGADSTDGFHRGVAWRGRPLAGPPPDSKGEPFVDRTLLSFNDMTWELMVWPTRELQTRLQSGLPNLLLAFGLVMSGLVALALQLGRTLQANARTAEQTRLRLALGRSMDRAWSWEISTPQTNPVIRTSSSGQEVREGAWTELIHPSDQTRVEGLLAAHLQGLTPTYEARYRTRGSSGDWQWLVDRGYVSERSADGTPLRMLGVSGDISERERVDQERESSERRFRAIFDSAHHLQGLTDREGRILEANPAALALIGPDPSFDAILGKPLAEAPWWAGPEVRVRVGEATERARNGELVTLEVEATGPGGDRVVFDFSIKPIRDGEGRVVQLLAEGLDITARRRVEGQLREVETLSTMGRLAARVAHEINNPLAGIQNAFLLLRDAIPSDHPHYNYVGAMEREIRRIAGVTRQLYETYRPETNGGGGAGVRTLIGDAVALLSQVNRPSRVIIEADLDRLPSEVAIPESVLRQSVYNLVQNAVEASPAGGTVTVRAEATNGEFVLRVRDQGPGISAAVRPDLFKPFVSTKDRSVPTSGMGIGLSLVHRSLEAVGGTIEIVEPAEGGTEFVVRMPISEKTR